MINVSETKTCLSNKFQFSRELSYYKLITESNLYIRYIHFQTPQTLEVQNSESALFDDILHTRKPLNNKRMHFS